MVSPETALGLSSWFSAVIERGRRMVAEAAGRRRDRTLDPVMMVFWNWMARAMRLFERSAQRVAQGLPPPRPRPPRPSPQRPEPLPVESGSPPPKPKPLRLPSSRAWMLRLVPNEGLAWVGTILHHRITTDSELQALLAAAPELGRVLRPILRAFGSPPLPLLDLPKRPRTPRPRKPRETRPRPADWMPSQAELTRILALPPGMPDLWGTNSKPYGRR